MSGNRKQHLDAYAHSFNLKVNNYAMINEINIGIDEHAMPIVKERRIDRIKAREAGHLNNGNHISKLQTANEEEVNNFLLSKYLL